jgi:glycerol-3-phosphate acyltransferase PlsX
MKMIIDVMGGDNAPEETVKGAIRAMKEYGPQIEYVLVGDEKRIREIAAQENCALDGVSIVHTDCYITMEDNPVAVMRDKKDSSMAVALRMLAAGEGDAVVSTGNTGALFTGAMLIVKKIKNLQRAGIAAIISLKTPVLLLDTGANVEVTSDNLEQFAHLGSVYMEKIYGIKNPRIALLNNGSEEHKGTPLQQEAYQKLKADSGINFVGNVEGSTVAKGVCDVVITDGYTGNIMLKSIEGTGKFILGMLKDVFLSGAAGKLAYLLIKKPLAMMKKKIDPNETGGAPLLGISKPVIKAHGSSNAQAFKNAIGQAISYAESGAIEQITQAMAEYAAQKAELKKEKKAEMTDEISAPSV